MAKKFDGVIEAVRYKDGQIELVRAFERRGATFSDWILLPRHELLGRLKKGLRYTVGKRTELLASTFELQDKLLKVLENHGREVISTGPNAEHDVLENAPVF
jgi:hypothetical protein